ncbi:hypothetical protein N8083_00615 [Candidatus Pacebacteria bacterium]|nr:hypothetical protein [Candidatus Paceibacterota bacterium]
MQRLTTFLRLLLAAGDVQVFPLEGVSVYGSRENLYGEAFNLKDGQVVIVSSDDGSFDKVYVNMTFAQFEGYYPKLLLSADYLPMVIRMPETLWLECRDKLEASQIVDCAVRVEAD